MRRTVAMVLAVCAGVSAVLLGGAPARAHGALSSPASRALECGPLGGTAAKSAACVAADAASGGPAAFTDWDNVRVPNVNGQDRTKIPDGKLCGGGLPAFTGLDLARADWPATTLTAGASFTFQYRTTIPHQGSFRLYVTNSGYSPTQPLRWADIETTPFATVSNPSIVNGAYVIRGTLPKDRPGRQIIYAIWQTTSTPDTYYSCSDVVFTGGVPAAAPAVQSAPAPAPTSAAPVAVAVSPADSRSPIDAVQAASVHPAGGSMMLSVIAMVAGAVVLIAAGLLVMSKRRAAVRVVPERYREREGFWDDTDTYGDH